MSHSWSFFLITHIHSIIKSFWLCAKPDYSHHLHCSVICPQDCYGHLLNSLPTSNLETSLPQSILNTAERTFKNTHLLNIHSKTIYWDQIMCKALFQVLKIYIYMWKKEVKVVALLKFLYPGRAQIINYKYSKINK